MRIAPFSFKEFDAGVVVSAKRPGMQPLLPGGRQKEEAPPPPPPPPTYNEEELSAAKQEAYKKGFTDGTQEGRAQAENEQAAIDRELLDRVGQFARAVEPLMADYKAFVLQMREDLPRVAQVIARKVASDALTQGAQDVIERVALSCCQTMMGEPKLVITAPAAHAPTIERKVKELAQRMQSACDIVVSPDEQMPASDCRIEWQHGQLERSTEQLWAQVERAIGDMIASASHSTDTHMQTLQEQMEINRAGQAEGSAPPPPQTDITPKE